MAKLLLMSVPDDQASVSKMITGTDHEIAEQSVCGGKSLAREGAHQGAGQSAIGHPLVSLGFQVLCCLELFSSSFFWLDVCKYRSTKAG